jgi:hypothetical protein
MKMQSLKTSATKNKYKNQTQWLMSIIPVTWEAEIGWLMVLGQPDQKVRETPSQPMS